MIVFEAFELHQKLMNQILHFEYFFEVTFQYVYNVPVELNPSSFSLINMGSGFARFFPDSLKNTGTGYNYGLEVTVQKYFDKSFFFHSPFPLNERLY